MKEKRSVVTGYGLPQTDKQRRYLHVVTDQYGWDPDQVRGRAAEICPQSAVDGLDLLNREQMSRLIDAVKTEPPWIDPRQRRLPL